MHILILLVFSAQHDLHAVGDWVTICRTRNLYIRHSSVLLLEIYSSISEAFRVAYAGNAETSGVEVVLALGKVEVGWIVVLPVPGNLGSWLVFE